MFASLLLATEDCITTQIRKKQLVLTTKPTKTDLHGVVALVPAVLSQHSYFGLIQ